MKLFWFNNFWWEVLALGRPKPTARCAFDTLVLFSVIVKSLKLSRNRSFLSSEQLEADDLQTSTSIELCDAFVGVVQDEVELEYRESAESSDKRSCFWAASSVSAPGFKTAILKRKFSNDFEVLIKKFIRT